MLFFFSELWRFFHLAIKLKILFSLEDLKASYKYLLNLNFLTVLCIRKMRLLLSKIWKEIL